MLLSVQMLSLQKISPDNSVAVGIPAKVISDKGQEYFNLVTNRID